MRPAGPPAGFTETPFAGRMSFRSYSADEGLTSLGIWSLVQDRDGFLWLGSDLGLFRYDGQRFIFLGRKQGLRGDMVDLLWADPQGGIWVGSGGGLDHLQDGRIQPMGPAQGLPAGGPISMCRDGQGRLWIAYGEKLLREEAPGRFRELPITTQAYFLAWAPRHGGMLVTGLDGRVELWGDKPLQTWNVEARLGREPFGALEDGQGRLWVLNRDGLFFKRPGPGGFQPFPQPVLQAGGQRRMLAPDGQGGFWVATGAGLLHVRGEAWSTLTDRNGLPTHWAGAVMVDHEGSLWYAGGGLYRQMGLGSWFNFTPDQGLPTEIVWTLRRDRFGCLWAGTDKGLAYLEGQRWQVVAGTEGFSFQNLVELADGALLAAGEPAVIVRVAPRQRTASFHPLLAEHFKANFLHLFTDAQGRAWALDRALWRLDWKAGRLVVAETLTPPPGGPPLSATTTFQGQDGRIWLADSKDGLLEFQAGRWRRWETGQGLLDNALNGAVEGPDGSIYVCYRDNRGLTRLVRDGGGFQVLRHYREEAGELPTNSVFSVHKDVSGRIWLNTNLGAVLLQEDGYRVFGRGSGFLNPDMVQGAFWCDPDGHLWFGTGGGLMHFDAKSYPWRLAAPEPVVTELRFGGKAVPVGGSGTLQIQPGDNTLEAFLGCLSFSREKAFRTEVRLEGLETAWRTEALRVRYPALPPGTYDLQVRTVWNGRPGPVREVAFRVLPRWYQAWSFRVLLFLSFGPALWGLLAWRNRRLKARNLHLEELIQARTQELASANARLQEQNLSDPMTGLHNRRYLMLTLPEQVARIERNLSHPTLPPAMLPEHPLVFFMLDIDHFKRVNDEYGHDAGDQVLIQLGEVLNGLVRGTDSVVRLGGEEFLVLARHVAAGDASWLAERLRRGVAEHAFTLDSGLVLRETVSIGFCPFPLGNSLPVLPWEKAVLLADRAMYAAKVSGRDGWVGLNEGPAFDPAILLSTAGHPDLGDLLERNLLLLATSFPEVQAGAWMG